MNVLVAQDTIEKMIFLVRGKKIMIDRDIATLYQVETAQLKRAVRRNIERFPEDFMFELTAEEHRNLRRQIGASRWGGERYLPYAFTENGVAMLSSVLRSDRAVQINIQIMRVFTRMRALMATDVIVRKVIEEHEKRLNVHDRLIQQAFEIVKKVLAPDPAPINSEYSPDGRKKIGFVPKKR